MKNMNARCYCSHRLSQHSSSGECAMCAGTGKPCRQFTEALHYRCEVCDELIPVEDAPNDVIVRLRYKDDGKNYAHKVCLVKRRDTKLAGLGTGAQPKKVAPTLMLMRDDVLALSDILARLGVFDPTGEIDPEFLNKDEGPGRDNEYAVQRKIQDYFPS